jgi:hypothetical protein
VVVEIRIKPDSDTWLALKHMIRECGYRYVLHEDPERFFHLELIPRQEEPEGGQLKHGFIVLPGGCQIGSVVQEVYDAEINRLTIPIQDKPAAKSSTSVAAAATTCQVCGCRKGPNTQKKKDCDCRCH